MTTWLLAVALTCYAGNLAIGVGMAVEMDDLASGLLIVAIAALWPMGLVLVAVAVLAIGGVAAVVLAVEPPWRALCWLWRLLR